MRSTQAAIWLMAIVLLAPSSITMAAPESPYRPTGTKLYQSDEVFQSRVPGGAMKLGSFVHSLSQALGQVLSSSAPGQGFGGAVVVIIKPGQQFRHWVVTPTPLATELEEALDRSLDKVSPPTVQNGPVVVAMEFDAWGGGKDKPKIAAPRMPTPAEWQAILGHPAQKPMQDSDIERLWR